MRYLNDPENGDFIQRNAAHFASILGTLSDYTVNDRYNDYEKNLLEYKKRYDDYNKYKTIRQKIANTQLDDAELQYLQEQQGVDFTPDLLQTEAYQKFNELNPSLISKITGKPYRSNEDSQKFIEFLKSQYSVNGEINPDYAKFVKTKPKDLTEEELLNAYLLKSDISDEEKALFNQYRNFDIDTYNKKVQNDILRAMPMLNSRGWLGDTLSNTYAKRGANYLLEGEKPQKKTNQFNDGKMFTFDEYGNLIQTRQIKEDVPKEYSIHKDAQIKMFQDEQGNTLYGYFKPDPNAADAGFTGWKYTGVSATQRDYEAQEGLGEFAKKSGTSGRRTSRGTSKTAKEDQEYSDLDAETVKMLKDFAEVKIALESNKWNKDDVGYAGTDETKYIELQKKLQSLLPGEDVDALANDLYKTEFKSKDKTKEQIGFVKDRVETSTYKNDLLKFQKDIEENVYAYDDGTGTKKANYSISPADWARELIESGFLNNLTPEQEAVLAEWFYSKTGAKFKDYFD